MQKKGNIIRCESQIRNLIGVRIDMRSSLWTIQDWEIGRMSYYGQKDKHRLKQRKRAFINFHSKIPRNSKKKFEFFLKQ